LDVSFVVSTQAPSQVVFIPHASVHAPFSQTRPEPQTFPHAPQFFGSAFVLTQLPEH